MTLALAAPLAAQGGSQLPALAESQLAEVAKTVKTLRVEPQTVTLKVGEKMDLNRLVVTVFDSAGKPVGRLVGYDFSIPRDQAAEVVPRVVTGKHPGTTELTIRYPRNFWKARTDPRAEVKVKVIVK